MKLFTYLLLIASVFCVQINANAQNNYSSSVNEKIRSVENNLLPNIMADGDAPLNIQQRMAYYNVRGVSIAVIHDHKIEWAKGYGWADLDSKRPVTTKTLFQAGSVSKSLNAIGVLKLVQDHKIDLYKDINDYLTSWKFPYDSLSKNKKITLANLLSHTAGLTVHGFAGYEKGKALPTITQILNGQKPANSAAIRSMYQPGLRYEYSGGGITISQLIVMDVTHVPYDRYMYNTVLKPMGMTESSYTQPPVDTQGLLASGYDEKGFAIKNKYHIYPEQAAAGLWTNPTDLAKYIIETQLAFQGKSNKVLDQRTTKLRLTPYIDAMAGFGVFIDDMAGEKYFQHGGSDVGFRTQYYGSMEDGNGVVVMVNSDSGGILDEIINSVAKIYQFKGLNRAKIKNTVVVANNVLQKYTGKYQLAPNFTLTISREENRMYGQGTGQEKLEIFPETQNKFFLKIAPIEIEFIENDKGEVTKAILYQNGTHEAKKIE
jgi:CubicO group peptidase (beta-lactamase class C family)